MRTEKWSLFNRESNPFYEHTEHLCPSFASSNSKRYLFHSFEGCF